MDNLEEMLRSLSEEELEQAAMAGLLTPRQKRLLNITTPSAGMSRGSSPLSGIMSGSPYYAPPQRDKVMAPASRAFAYSSVRVVSAGLDAMAQADSWSRSSLEEAGFYPSYFLGGDENQHGSPDAADHSAHASALAALEDPFHTRATLHGAVQGSHATTSGSGKKAHNQSGRNARPEDSERRERRSRQHSDTEHEPTGGPWQSAGELQRKRPKIGTPLIELTSARSSSQGQ